MTLILGLLLAAALVLVPAMPLGGRIPGIDSGVFLYEGWRTLHGALGYRDVWDHKPPLVHLLDALGLAAGGGSEWGVWALQLAFLAAACLLLLRLVRPRAGSLAAWGAAALFCAGLTLTLEGGNLTEQYGAALQLLFLALAVDERPLEAGACAGALFLLKQNLVALPLAWAGRQLWRRRWDAAPALARAAAGAAAVLGLCAAYFAARGGFAGLWSQAFLYNAVNRTTGLGALAGSAWFGLKVLLPCGLPLLAAAGWLLVLRRGAAVDGRGEPFLLCALALPLELAFAAGTGRLFRHYFMAWLPSMSVLAALVLGEVDRRAGRPVAAALCLLLALAPARAWARQTRALWSRRGPNPVVALLREKAGPGQAVLIWGAQARFNFAARRRAPTRLVYQYPVYRAGWRGEALARELAAALKADPPAVIVDWSGADPDFPPLDARARAAWRPDRPDWRVPRALDEVFSLIEKRYRAAGRIGPCPVYLPR